MEAKKENETFKILSLDGGGIKGLFAISVLAKIEEKLNIKCSDEFDMFAGTSTGSIIALGLASGLSANEIKEAYIEMGPKIFKNKSKISFILNAKHNNNDLKLELEKLYKNKKIEDIQKRNKKIIIPATNLTNELPRIFKTDYQNNYKEHNQYNLSDIAVASCSAPTFFSTYRIKKPNEQVYEYFCDGGLFANNPSTCAIVEAIGVMGIQKENIKLLSIATENQRSTRGDNKIRSGLINWDGGKKLITTTLKQTTEMHRYITEIIMNKNQLRLEPHTCISDIELDDASKKSIQRLILEGIDIANTCLKTDFISELFSKGEIIEQSA